MTDLARLGLRLKNLLQPASAAGSAVLALLATAAALGLAFLLHAAIGRYVPFLSFFIALIVVALYGPLSAALLTVALSTAVLAGLWQRLPGWVPVPFDATSLAVFAFLGALVAVVIHRASAGRRVAQQRFEAALDGSSVIAWECDEQQRYTWVYNPGAPVDARTMIGRRIGAVMPREGYPEYADALERVWKTGRAESLPVAWVHGEATRHYLSTIKPVKNARGAVIGLIGASVDVTPLHRAQEEASRARAELQSITELMASGVIQCGRDTRYRWASRRYLEWLGRPPEEVLGRTMEEVLGAELFDTLRPFVERVLAGESVTFERRARLPRGEERWVHAAYTPERDGAGHVDGWVGVISDITARKEMEEALSRSERRLRVMLDAQPECVKVVAADGTLLDINPAGLAMLEATAAEVHGRNVYELIVPEGRPAFRELLEGALASHPCEQPREFEIVGLRGTRRLMESRAVPLREESGEIRSVLSVTRDVTARKRMEQELRTSEQAFKTITNAGPALVWVCSPAGEATYLNDRWYEFTGRSPADSLGTGWTTAVHPQDRERIIHHWNRCCATGETYEGVTRYRRHDGEYVWHEFRALPRREADGRIAAWYGMSFDVSTLMQVDEALREADRRKDEFLAILAHELRNPLAPLRSSLDLMNMSSADAATARHARAIMQRQLDQMVRLVDDLLDVSRITRGMVQLQKTRVQLGPIVRGAAETCLPAMRNADQSLELHIAPEPIFVSADETRLAQVFTNLINNASKYTPRGGRIRIGVVRTGNDAVVTVQDNGRGIAPDMLGKVFDMFTRAQPSGEGGQAGLGVGLSIAKHLVELHGGRIEARSDGPGKGSQFAVSLPVILALVGAEAGLAGPGVDMQAAPRRRVLVVDDNVDAAESLAMLLKAMGHDTRTAHDGFAGLELADLFRPDIVLLDIGMPRMDGYEVCRRLRQQQGGDELTIVAVTGWGQEASKQNSREAGFDAHLVKPVDLARLEAVLAGSRTRVA